MAKHYYFSATSSFPTIPAIPDRQGKVVRWYALGVGLVDFLLMIYAFWHNYNLQNVTLQLVESYPWIPQIGLNWSLAVDGLSLPLVLFTGLTNTLGFLRRHSHI